MSSMVRPALLLGLSALTTLLLGPSCNGAVFEGDDDSVGGEAGSGATGTGASAGLGAGADGGAGAGAGGADASAGAGSGGVHDAQGGEASGGGGASGRCTVSDDCASGDFCRDGACVSCADFSDLGSLAYGAAEPLDLLNDSADKEALRFARRVHEGTGLVYVRDFFGGALWFTSDPASGAGAPVSKTDVYENGGLPLALELPAPLAGLNLFFSRRARSGDDSANTYLFGAVLAEDGTVTEEQKLPAPFNSEKVVASFGLALSAERAVWIRNVDGMLGVQLVTSPLPPQGEPSELRLPLPDGCGYASEFDFVPWLTPDGSTLFFAARRVDEGCTPAADAITHIYVLALSGAGQPVGVAHALTGLAQADLRQSDPSLSPDGCELLFSAQQGDALQLYRARRIQ